MCCGTKSPPIGRQQPTTKNMSVTNENPERIEITERKPDCGAASGSGQSIVCPFKVGDRVRNKFNGHESTVTAVTLLGFDWKLDSPIYLIAREGSWYDCGTCYPIGYEHYELVQNAELTHREK